MDDNNETPSGYVTVAEAARRLHRSTEQVRRYLREGKLPGRRIGGQWFIEESALAAPPEQQSGRGQVREVATMEYTATSKEKTDIEALIARIAENREAIRKRIGDLKIDVVELLREDRESH